MKKTLSDDTYVRGPYGANRYPRKNVLLLFLAVQTVSVTALHLPLSMTKRNLLDFNNCLKMASLLDSR